MAERVPARPRRVGGAVVLLGASLAAPSLWAAEGPPPPAPAGAEGQNRAARPRLPTVAIRNPDAEDTDLQAAALRIRAELAAAGFNGRIVDCPPDEDLAVCDGEAAARISLLRFDDVVTVEIVATMGTGLSLRRKTQVPKEPGTEEAAVIAVRATELLRDLYLEIPRVANAPPSAPEPALPAARPPTAPPARFSLGVSSGVALLEGRRGLGPALGPVGIVSLGIGAHLAVLATFAVPFSERLSGSIGTAVNARQAVGFVGARYELGRGRLRPYGMLAAGLHYLHVRGETTRPTQVALTGSAWAPLVAGGLGAYVTLGRWLFVGAEASLFFTEPSTDITAGSARVGTAGAPSLLAFLNVGARLPLSAEKRSP